MSTPARGTRAAEGAVCEHADRKLWPGQFVNVRLTLNVLHAALTIPKSAVNQGPEQPYAYVIGADNHVSVRPIKVRLVQDATAVIDAGLQPGRDRGHRRPDVPEAGQPGLRPPRRPRNLGVTTQPKAR